MLATWLVLGSALVGPALIAAALGGAWARRRALWANLAGQALLLLLSAAVLASARALPGLSLARLGLVPPTALTPVIAAVLAFAFIFALGPALMALASRLRPGGFQPGLDALAEVPTWALGLAVLVGGVVEELLYRGVAFTLAADAVGPWAGALLVSAAFALAHVPLWGLGASLTTGLSGLAFTAAYAVTGNLWANALAHVAVDAVGILLPRLASSAAPKV